MGHVVRSWLMSACAQSRAVEVSMASLSVVEVDVRGGSGLESVQRRWARSNV